MDKTPLLADSSGDPIASGSDAAVEQDEGVVEGSRTVVEDEKQHSQADRPASAASAVVAKPGKWVRVGERKLVLREHLKRGEALYRLLNDRSFVERWLPLMLVLVPLLYATFTHLFVQTTGVITGCHLGSGDFFIIFGFDESKYYPLNTTTCVRLNNQQTTVQLEGVLLAGNDPNLIAYGVIFSVMYILAFGGLMYYADLIVHRARKLLPYRIFVTGTRRQTYMIFGEALLLLVLISITNILQDSANVHGTERDSPVGCEEGLGALYGFRSAYMCAYVELSNDFSGQGFVGYLKHVVPLLLSFSGFFSYIAGRWKDIYGGISLRQLVTDASHPQPCQQIGAVSWKIAAADLDRILRRYYKLGWLAGRCISVRLLMSLFCRKLATRTDFENLYLVTAKTDKQMFGVVANLHTSGMLRTFKGNEQVRVLVAPKKKQQQQQQQKPQIVVQKDNKTN